MGGKGSGTPKAEIMKLDGTAIDMHGKVTQTDFFSFLNLPAEHYANLEKTMTADQALKFRNHIVRMKVGTSAMMPMLCGGPECPVTQCPFHAGKNWPLGEQCHPAGTYVRVTGNQQVLIEELDPNKHKIVSFHCKKHRVMTNWKNGYDFSISSKHFQGNLVNINTGVNYYKATPDHICVARFNEKAIDKFCVYLMRKDNHWRIGKSRLCAVSTDNKHHLPFTNRGKHENADSMWVLGVYDLNTDALLAEEYFSVTWEISKISFSDSLNKYDSKYNGLYKWATKDQINKHYGFLSKDESFYRKKLESLNLSIDYPIWNKDNTEKTVKEIKLFPRQSMFIRACNLISDVMEVPVYPKDIENSLHCTKCQWLPFQISYEEYSAPVYSLDVKNEFKTYFANDIATHNCPIEGNLIAVWTASYVEDIGVEPDNRTEMILVNKLVECDMIDYRANVGLSKDKDGWTLIKTDLVSDGDGGTTELTSAHPLLEIKERTHTARMKVLESFNATRREKAKKAAMLKQREDGDVGAHWADMKQFIAAYQKDKNKGSMAQIKQDAKDVASSDFVEADWETKD